MAFGGFDRIGKKQDLTPYPLFLWEKARPDPTPFRNEGLIEDVKCGDLTLIPFEIRKVPLGTFLILSPSRGG